MCRTKANSLPSLSTRQKTSLVPSRINQFHDLARKSDTTQSLSTKTVSPASKYHRILPSPLLRINSRDKTNRPAATRDRKSHCTRINNCRRPPQKASVASATRTRYSRRGQSHGRFCPRFEKAARSILNNINGQSHSQLQPTCELPIRGTRHLPLARHQEWTTCRDPAKHIPSNKVPPLYIYLQSLSACGSTGQSISSRININQPKAKKLHHKLHSFFFSCYPFHSLPRRPSLAEWEQLERTVE